MTATIRRDPAVWQAYKEHVTTAVADQISKASPKALSAEMAAWITGLNARADRTDTHSAPLPQALTSALTRQFHGSQALTAGAVATEAGAKDVWLAGAQVAVKQQIQRVLEVVGTKDLAAHLDQAIDLQKAIIRTKGPAATSTPPISSPSTELHVNSVNIQDRAPMARAKPNSPSDFWPARPGIGGRNRTA